MTRLASVAIGAVMLLPLPAIAQTGVRWTCTAPGLVVGSYTGGDGAYIHLVGFNSGSSYAVTRQRNGTVTGETRNGTRFTCRRAR